MIFINVPYVYVRVFFLVGAFVFALGHKLTIAFKSIHFGCACTLYILHFTVFYFYATRDSTPHFEPSHRSDSCYVSAAAKIAMDSNLLWTLSRGPALQRGQIPTVRQNEGT
jgi:hypothetical protein